MAAILLGIARQMAIVVDVLNRVTRALLSPACAVCHTALDRPIHGPVCPACWLAIAAITPPQCTQCGDALVAPDPDDRCERCRRVQPCIAVIRSIGRYEGALRRIVHVFKYRHQRALARPLAERMREAGIEVLADADAVIPVPLHPLRALRRGFNQADDLARHLGLPVWRVLRRTRRGPPQAALPAARRGPNVEGAFAVKRRWPRLAPLSPSTARLLRNRTVVLVDDVMTTGATLEACGATLLAAGVRTVRAVTVARATARRPTTPRSRPRLSSRSRR